MSRIKNDTADSSGMEVRGMVKVTSLGCAKNFVDTEVASASFLCEGFGLTSSDTDADIQFSNTCAFLEDARNTCPAYFRGLHWHNLLKTLTTLCNALEKVDPKIAEIGTRVYERAA